MGLNRREFIATLAGAGFVCGFRLRESAVNDISTTVVSEFPFEQIHDPLSPGIDYGEWLVFDNNNNVKAFTGRTEMGQGLRSVTVGLIGQALEMPLDKVTLMMGDTDICPDDGPTSGSSATGQVGWGFWKACKEIKKHVVKIASDRFNAPIQHIEYSAGVVRVKNNPSLAKSVFELGNGKVVMMDIEADSSYEDEDFKDLNLTNVNGYQIVTGKMRYCADINPRGTLYGGILGTKYHKKLTKLESADFKKAKQVPGVKDVFMLPDSRPAVVAESFNAVQKGLKAIDAEWSKPDRPRKFNFDQEVRDGAELLKVVEDVGDVDSGLAASADSLTETYYTLYMSSCPLETSTALASFKNDRLTAWVSSQYPHGNRLDISRRLGIPPENIRLKGMHVGGGFGSKLNPRVSIDATSLSRAVRKPVKYVYSRDHQFRFISRAKEACAIDLTTGVDNQGKIKARSIDIYQDEGHGTTNVYDIPNSLTNLYRTQLPLRHMTSRGTSYLQTVFAVESHMDEMAAKINMDPLEFRLKNVSVRAFKDLIPAAAEMIGYGSHQSTGDTGIGMSIINHGGMQLAAVFVEVHLKRATGKITVKRICAAIDVGIVINHSSLLNGIRGSFMWGIGYALKELVKADGHKMTTRSLAQYNMSKFSDTPEMNVKFMQVYPSNRPRGAGEMAVPTIAPAVANAVRNITGTRLYQTPFLPSRVKKLL